MWAVFKPLFAYRKYLFAHDVLKQCTNSFVWATNSDNEEKFLTEKNFGETYLSAFLLQEKDLDTVRLIEAIELSEDNGYLITNKNTNLYKYSIKLTKHGERAFNDGYYLKKAYRNIAAIIVGAISILGGTIGLLVKFL